MAGIYVHIPFCTSRCIYCDFYSTLRIDLAEHYVQALVQELKRRKAELGGASVRTLYIGGGTPSTLPIDLLLRLVDDMRQVVDLSGVTEFTIEANPNDVTSQWVASLTAIGVNRISLGVQSFDDELLRWMRRRHNARQAVDAVRLLQRAGLDNISIDLIYGIPHQSQRSWVTTIEQAIGLGVQHLSAYCLTYEPGTPLWRAREQHAIEELSDDECIAMYHQLEGMLREAQFIHYEISNYALPGYHSRHNSAYWDGTPYLGIGASAHSYDGVATRRYNPADLQLYLDGIDRDGQVYDQEVLQPWERYDEYVMLALRTAQGVNLQALRHRFGNTASHHFVTRARPHIADGLLQVQDGSYRLTSQGILLSDSVIRDLMCDSPM